MQEAIRNIFDEDIMRIIISNQRNKNQTLKKVIVRKIKVKEQMVYQFEKYTKTQVFHENVKKDGAIALCVQLLREQFRQAEITTKGMAYFVKLSKKEKLFISKKKMTLPNVEVSHNRSKQYLIPDGTFVAPLYDLGIFTKEGKVVNTMYDKYKQINRFIEMINDCITPEMKELSIIDFGCGKSYLTFILYYYLVEIKKIKVNMIGLDLKADVIQNCNEIAEKYGYEGLHFEIGDINGYQCDHPVDMVISLHACDTATDYALYNAISWNAKMIFSVPCCQHELNGQIQSEHFGITTRYGLLKERFAAILTDEIRANLLEYCSYKVQVLEFIDLAHSPKNILLRCVKSDTISQQKKEKALQEVEAIKEEYHLDPTLYRLLMKE